MSTRGINLRCPFSTIAGVMLLAIFTGNTRAQPTVLPPPSVVVADELAPTALVRSMRQDAELLDVVFVNRQIGWAVGDRGVILHTSNGGAKWSLQKSGVSCRLQSVFFVDPENGWVAGGYTEPYTHVSRGVVLRTFDGGKTWTAIRRARIPKVQRIQFFDNRRGWAVTETSGLFGQGLLTTDDGGRTWAPVPARGGFAWLSGSFSNPGSGIVVGRNGVVGQVQRRTVSVTQTQHFGIRSLRRIEMIDLERGYAVGDGGLRLARSEQRWHDISETEGQVDFCALAVVGEQVWTAGSPGSHVYHSPDGGRHWQKFGTGQSLPIRALKFVDQQHGWAVGALGTILFSDNGGRTWQRQRGSQRRAAVLGIFARAEDVPMETIANLCAGSGYVGAIHLVGRDDFDPLGSADAFSNERSIESLIGTGASSVRRAWRFPIRPRSLDLPSEKATALWDQVNQGASTARLQQDFSRQIRMWKPDIVLTPSARGTSLDGVIHNAVLEAVKHAAVVGQQSQPTVPDLDGWQVKRVFAALPPNISGSVKVTTARVPSGLGRSLSEFVARPKSLLAKTYHRAAVAQQFNLVADEGSNSSARRDFFAGLAISPGSEARRNPTPGTNEVSAANNRIAERRRVVEAIVASAARDGRTAAAALAQINRFTSELDKNAGAELLFQLGSLFHSEGRWALAAEAFTALADGYPKHELTMPAMVWLLQYYASSEVQHIARGKTPTVVRQVGADPLDVQNGQVARPEDIAASGSQVQTTERQALAWAKRIQQNHVLLHGEPYARFPLAAVLRRQNEMRQADRTYRSVQLATDRDAWWQNATGEMRRIARGESRGEASPIRKPVVTCRRVDSKPLLDGHLTEPYWKEEAEDDGAVRAAATVASLRSAHNEDAKWPASVRLAYDDSFLYIAARCKKAPGADYPATNKPRTRDADLASRDRIEVLVDLDRDWTTYYRLAIDHRGWTHDACGGAAAWNPKWFVAAVFDDEYWTCEAAIPLKELTTKNPQSKSAWAVGIQRIVPRVGFQSWTQPSGPDILPEGFGYLEFE
jgi:photosystem II stability/assembly factor-like uncharacterized protein